MPANFREHPPTFMFVVQVHILGDAQEGDRGWLKNTSPLKMAVEESPLGPLWRSRPLLEIGEVEKNSL